jgi:GNAT superfamily N-acetyltransferase
MKNETTMADDPIEIRALQIDDILPLTRICNQTFLEWARFPEHGVQAVRRIREQPQWQWGAFAGPTLCAFLLCHHQPDKKTVAIKLIGVTPEARRCGIGRRLLAQLESAARRTGRHVLSVGTPFAAAFYERNGYVLSHTTLRMIRDITCQVVSPPSGMTVRPIGMDDAQSILENMVDTTQKARFLEAFLAHYRQNGRLMVRMDCGSRLAGVGLGAADAVYGDFARVSLALPLDGTTLEVVRGIEYAVSTQGLRHVGFQIDEEQEALYRDCGYERAARDYFWTMYTLRKELA